MATLLSTYEDSDMLYGRPESSYRIIYLKINYGFYWYVSVQFFKINFFNCWNFKTSSSKRLNVMSLLERLSFFELCVPLPPWLLNLSHLLNNPSFPLEVVDPRLQFFHRKGFVLANPRIADSSQDYSCRSNSSRPGNRKTIFVTVHAGCESNKRHLIWKVSCGIAKYRKGRRHFVSYSERVNLQLE